MEIRCIPARQLSGSQALAWTAIQASNRAFASPFLSPEFTLAVASVRDDIFVTILFETGKPAGFFPFQKRNRIVGMPVGGPLSNFQAVIAEQNLEWDIAEIVRGSGIRILDFSHQILSQKAFDPFMVTTANSYAIDLSAGWDAYVQSRHSAGVSRLRDIPYDLRRLQRDYGAIRFEPHLDEPAIFDQLISWKLAKYRVGDVGGGSLAQDWAVAAMRRMFATNTSSFKGALSCLFAGNRLIAAHAGIRTAAVWSYMFPAYDPELGKRSPGIILLWKMCEWAAANGIETVDLGKGDQPYKLSFGNANTPIAEGRVVVPSASATLFTLGERMQAATYRRSKDLKHLASRVLSRCRAPNADGRQ